MCFYVKVVEWDISSDNAFNSIERAAVTYISQSNPRDRDISLVQQGTLATSLLTHDSTKPLIGYNTRWLWVPLCDCSHIPAGANECYAMHGVGGCLEPSMLDLEQRVRVTIIPEEVWDRFSSGTRGRAADGDDGMHAEASVWRGTSARDRVFVFR